MFANFIELTIRQQIFIAKGFRLLVSHVVNCRVFGSIDTTAINRGISMMFKYVIVEYLSEACYHIYQLSEQFMNKLIQNCMPFFIVNFHSEINIFY